MNRASDPRLEHRFAVFSATASLVAVGIGLVACSGWVSGVAILRSWVPGANPIRPMSALGYILLGTALWLMRAGQAPTAQVRIFVRTVCVVVLFFSLQGLAEHLFDWQSGLEHLLRSLNPAVEAAGPSPELHSFIAAITLSLLALALPLLDWQTRRGDWPAQVPVGAAVVVSVFALLNFAVRKYFPVIEISLPGACACSLLSAGALCSRPDRAFLGLLTSTSAGGKWLRRALPTGLLLQAIMSWSLAGTLFTNRRLSWVEASVTGIVTTLSLVGFVIWGASLMDFRQKQSDRARAALHLSREQIDLLMEDYENARSQSHASGWLKGAVVLGIALTCFGFFLCWQHIGRAEEDSDWTVHEQSVRVQIQTTLRHAVDVETGGRGYGTTGDPRFLEPYEQGVSALPGDMQRLEQLTAGDAKLRALFERLRTQMALRLDTANRTVALRRETGKIPDASFQLEGKQRMDAVRATIDEMESVEATALIDELERAAASRQRARSVILVCGLMGVVMLVLMGLVTSREINRSVNLLGQLQAVNSFLEQRVKERTEKLEKSEQQLRLFVEHAPAALAMFDADMRYIVASRRWLDDYRLGGRQVEGHSHYELLPEIPDRWKQIHRRAIAGEILHADDDRFERLDGRVQRLKWEIRPWYKENREVGGIVIFSEDITARAEAEEALLVSRSRLGAALSSMTDSVIITDSVGRIVEQNRGFKTYYRFADIEKRPDEILGYAAFLNLFSADSGEPTRVEDWPTLRALRGESATDSEYLIRRKDTGESWFGSYSYAPIRDDKGAVAGAVVVSRDVTQKRAADQEIRRLNGELEQRVEQRTAQLRAANEELEAFTYSVSHDLRAPLRHISGFSKLLMEEFSTDLPAEARRYLDRISEGTRRMGMLIDDLLNLGRVGRQELRHEITGLRAIVDEVMAELQPEFANRVVKWKIGKLPFLDCDPGLIKQVVSNLLSNALKFTRPRSPAVIEIGQQPDHGGTIIFVRDNGVGFSMKYADKLFGVFQRLHRQEDFEGTGVGLATVQRIIQKHGGRIWAEADLDKGATFYFTLAATAENAEALRPTVSKGPNGREADRNSVGGGQ